MNLLLKLLTKLKRMWIKDPSKTILLEYNNDMEDSNMKLKEAIDKIFTETDKSKTSTTYVGTGLYQQLKSNPTTTQPVLDRIATTNQIQDLHMLILNQQKQIDELTKAVEILLEQKILKKENERLY